MVDPELAQLARKPGIVSNAEPAPELTRKRRREKSLVMIGLLEGG